MSRELDELRSQPHWSFSALSKFLTCQLAYYFQYIERRQQEHTPVNLLFGSAFHAAATIIAVGQMDGQPESVESACDCFSDYWINAIQSAENVRFKDGDDIDSLNELGRKMINCIHAALQPEKVLAVAQAFSVPLLDDDGHKVSDLPLIGEFDLVIESAEGPVIVDWKTAARQWPADKAAKDLQATAFSYAWSVQHGFDPLFRFDVITKVRNPVLASHPTRRGIDDYQRLLKLFSVVERSIAAEVFLPNEQCFFCSDCVYAHACAIWHRQDATSYSLPSLFDQAA